MRKRVTGLILCIVLLVILPFPAFAANQIDTIDIQSVNEGRHHLPAGV